MSGVLLLDLRARSGYQARHQTPGESLSRRFCDGPKAFHHHLGRRADSAAKSRSDFRQGLQVSRSKDAPMHYLFRAPASLSRISRAREIDSALARLWIEKLDRKSTRLNSSHSQISYAVFCLKKKNKP